MQVLVVASSDPTCDTSFLVDLFPDVFQLNAATFSLASKESILVFVESENDRQNVVAWTTETAFPTLPSGNDAVRIKTLNSLEVCEITLPSGTILLQFSPLVSAVDHQTLARFVRQRAQNVPSVAIDSAESRETLVQVLPNFPTLNVQLLGRDGSYFPLALNSRVPIPVETELFRGKILVLLRPPNPAEDDPYWNERIFSQRQRRIIIQIQGQFVRQPQGVVYAGAQISDPMKLGLISRGVCSVLLRLVESFKKDVHYSYGSKTESAHIVAPAYSFFERVVVTPAGEVPPPMEDTFPEPQSSIAQRKTATEFTWNTTDTYSFSFFSMYIDLVTWKLVNIPATGDLSLKTFWGNSLLNICMYEKVGDGNNHLNKDNNYVFSVQAEYLGDKPVDSNSRRGDGSDTESIALLPWPEKVREASVGSISETLQYESTVRHSESQVFSSMDLSLLSPIRYKDEPILMEETELNFFDAEEGHDGGTQKEYERIEPSELLRMIDLKCPFWLEQHRGSSSMTFFAVNHDFKTSFRRSSVCESVVRSCAKNGELSKRVKQFSPRLSSLERLRRSLGCLLSDLSMSNSDLETFYDSSVSDEACLRVGSILRNENTVIAGTIARAISDRHWTEEWGVLSDEKQSLLFFRNADRRRHHFQVKLSTISKVEVVDQSLAPMMYGHRVLALTTIGRTLYLMIPSQEETDMWTQSLRTTIQSAIARHEEGNSSVESNVLRLFDIENIASEFIHNSTMWKCKNRRLLNCGKFHFCEGNALSVDSLDALAVVKEALLSTLAAQAEGLEHTERRRGFLDSVAKLKAVSIEQLEEDDKLVFFINLYHLMVSHAFLILGPPNSSLQWFKYFNSISYQVADDIFSLTELEHCIIRSNMTFPSQLFSKFVIPKTKFRWALTSTNDFRINFALNCGSLSTPETIFVYEASQIEEQLDEASRIYLESTTTTRTTGLGTLIVTLPRVVQWFAEDFGDDQVSRLNAIRHYLPTEVQQKMDACRRSELKYHSFSFECRPVTLYTASSASKKISLSTT